MMNDIPRRVMPGRVHRNVNRFSELLIDGSEAAMEGAADLIMDLSSLEAVQLILATYYRDGSIVGQIELECFADFLGCIDDEGDWE